MNDHTLRLLEFDHVRRQLADLCHYSGGIELARNLQPGRRLASIQGQLDLTCEAYAFLAEQPAPPFGGVTDVAELLSRATRRSILLGAELRDIRILLERTAALQKVFGSQAEEYPGLAELAARLQPCPRLGAAIAEAVDEQGSIQSGASPLLSSLRNRIRIAQGRLSRTLEGVASNSRLAPYLQEAIVTQRQGRYVVPVKAEYRGKVRGIVHDQSASGATVFVEPFQVVEQNNELRVLLAEEEAEIRRILTVLTAQVAEATADIGHNNSVLAELDFTLAKGRHAWDLECTAPELLAPPEFTVPYADQVDGDGPGVPPLGHPGTCIWLRKARHPLLPRDEAVPLDFELGPETTPAGHRPAHVVVITGPNTGGKTVALKTVGLLQLMAQAGLMIPAGSGSRLTILQSVWADIGDEQSIEQNLSTFSSHLTNIVGILEAAAPDSLVILDEIGAGTDPEEGSALALALLDHLRRRSVTTLASTHFSEIKLYAHNTRGVSNAAMEFDVESLRPTYRLTMGLPGKSNALTIARRLGLDQDVVAKAEGHVQADAASANSMLEDIRKARQQAVESRAEAARERDLAELARKELILRLSSVEEDRQAVLAETKAEMEGLLAETRREMSRLRRTARNQMRPDELGKRTGSRSMPSSGTEKDLAALAAKVPAATPVGMRSTPLRVPGQIAVGDTVWVGRLQTTAKVTALLPDGKRAEVHAGGMRFKAKLPELELRSRAQEEEPKPAAVMTTTRTAVRDVATELDIRGARVEAGVETVNQYLHDAWECQLPWVRVIHGKGTGQLRSAIRDLMRRHPHVAGIRSGEAGEGGEGVTVATIGKD
ncbi:MAG: endonuclease MutS2 [Caldilineaceae bacterium SB0666_bin_21]|nr:endonuclease MutS2 [Caldilineaceae bacterium SB0666_bin_21]